ncbi:MAG: hypothetical protein B7C24_04135 [Bacteroidetes bacterium 4572_77]|nr:MAG: hypothetical protein B7C24_04135 [Bacteroidetes bacterium 4572_77]
MTDNSSLSYPQKLSSSDFPKERKRKRRKKNGLFNKIHRQYKSWKEERDWKKSQKRRKEKTILAKIWRFLLAPFYDYLEDREIERERKKLIQKEGRPSFFESLKLLYQENRAANKQKKLLDRELRKSLSFVLEEDKRVFSFKEEIAHIKDTWKTLPWNKSREIENMILNTLVITFAFSFNYLLLQAAKFLTASFYRIPGRWENGRIIFPIPDPSPLWTYSSVISIYIAGPVFLFIVGVFFFWRYNKTKKKDSLQALSYLWLYLMAFIMFFGTFLAGSITDRGFGYVMGWLFIPKYIEVPFDIFFILMLWMIGFSSGKRFMSLAPSYKFYSNTLPQVFIKLLYIYIPVLLSISILLLIGFNNRDFTIQVVYLSIIGMLTPTLRFIPEKMPNYDQK